MMTFLAPLLFIRCNTCPEELQFIYLPFSFILLDWVS